MKFNSEAYEKLYPRQKPEKQVETAVEGFTPSAKEVNDEKVVETGTPVESEVESDVSGTDNNTDK